MARKNRGSGDLLVFMILVTMYVLMYFQLNYTWEEFVQCVVKTIQSIISIWA